MLLTLVFGKQLEKFPTIFAWIIVDVLNFDLIHWFVVFIMCNLPPTNIYKFYSCCNSKYFTFWLRIGFLPFPYSNCIFAIKNVGKLECTIVNSTVWLNAADFTFFSKISNILYIQHKVIFNYKRFCAYKTENSDIKRFIGYHCNSNMPLYV